MDQIVLISCAAMASLLPFLLLTLRCAGVPRGVLCWPLYGVALLGGATFVAVASQGGWNSGFAATLWVSVVASLLVFAITGLAQREAWRLSVLLMPYLLLLGLLATIWSGKSGAVPIGAMDAWLAVHIIVALLTYALATLAAVAATSVILQERALKSRNPDSFTQSLPSVTMAERLQALWLVLAEIVLALGIVTGMAKQYVIDNRLMALDHKTIFALFAFAVIALLLILQHKSGMRGRRAGRLLLVGYLLITLAYPGVKFVTDVLLS